MKIEVAAPLEGAAPPRAKASLENANSLFAGLLGELSSVASQAPTPDTPKWLGSLLGAPQSTTTTTDPGGSQLEPATANPGAESALRPAFGEAGATLQAALHPLIPEDGGLGSVPGRVEAPASTAAPALEPTPLPGPGLALEPTPLPGPGLALEPTPLPGPGLAPRDLRPAIDAVLTARRAAPGGLPAAAPTATGVAEARTRELEPRDLPRGAPRRESAREGRQVERLVAARVSDPADVAMRPGVHTAADRHPAAEQTALRDPAHHADNTARIDLSALERRAPIVTAINGERVGHPVARESHRESLAAVPRATERRAAEPDRLPLLARHNPSPLLEADTHEIPALRWQGDRPVFSTPPAPDPLLNELHDATTPRPTPLPASEGSPPIAAFEGRAAETRLDLPRGDGTLPTASLQPLTQSVEWLASRGGGMARLRLDPPHLGEVELQVRAVGSEIRISMITEDGGARVLLEAGREWLVEQFASRDLRVSHFEVQDRSAPGGQGDPMASRDAGDRQHRGDEGTTGRDHERFGDASRGTTLETAQSIKTATSAAGRRVDLRI